MHIWRIHHLRTMEGPKEDLDTTRSTMEEATLLKQHNFFYIYIVSCSFMWSLMEKQTTTETISLVFEVVFFKERRYEATWVQSCWKLSLPSSWYHDAVTRCRREALLISLYITRMQVISSPISQNLNEIGAHLALQELSLSKVVFIPKSSLDVAESQNRSTYELQDQGGEKSSLLTWTEPDIEKPDQRRDLSFLLPK